MTEILKTETEFIFWESHPKHSRDLIKPDIDVRRGDLLVPIAPHYVYQYIVYRGQDSDEDLSSYNGTGQFNPVAIALEDGKAGEKVSCLVRCAVVYLDRLNHCSLKELREGELSYIYRDIVAQQIKFIHSEQDI